MQWNFQADIFIKMVSEKKQRKGHTHEIENLQFGDANKPKLLNKTLAIGLCVLVVLVGGIHWLDRKYVSAQWSAEEGQRVKTAAELFILNSKVPLSDIAILAEDWHSFAAAGNSTDTLVRLFENFVKQKNEYYQVRVIDLDGMEKIRVQRIGDEVVRVPDNELQNKRGRSYFQEALSLSRGEIFVSPIELNVEHGEIELPITPVMRYATPITDNAGNKLGIIVINVLGSQLLSPIAELDRQYPGSLSLLDDEGQWLFSPVPERRWGLQLGHNNTFSLNKNWEQIQHEFDGQIQRDGEMLSFYRVQKTTHYQINDKGSLTTKKAENWYVVSSVSNSILYSDVYTRLNVLLAFSVIGFVCLIPISYSWSRKNIDLQHKRILNKLFFSLIDNSSDITYVTDRHGNIIYANAAVTENTGYTTEELQGRHSRLFRSGKHQQDFYNELWDSLRTGKSFTRTFINRKKNGDVFVELKTIYPIRDQVNDFVYYISVGKNMTELYQKDKKQLDILEKAITDTAFRFDQAMSLVSNYSQLVRDSLINFSPQLSEKFLDEIDGLIEHTRAVFHSMSYATDKIDSSDYLLPLSKVLKRSVERQRKEFSAQNYQVEFSEDFVDVRCMNNAMSIVFNALLENAAEASTERGKIVVSCAPLEEKDVVCEFCGENLEADFAVVTITDFGKGISQKDIPRVCEPFFTTKPRTYSQIDYQGLSMAIVKNILHSHGAHLGIRSEEGRFTEISLYIPQLSVEQLGLKKQSRNQQRAIKRYKKELEIEET